ncbi:unnamed protein product [Knipowitschia caucasica]
MATEQELRDLVQQLQSENERLLAASNMNSGAAVPSCSNDCPAPLSNVHSSNGESMERLLYIPRERKCPLFRGTSGIPIEDWIEEMRATLRTRRLTTVDQAYFVFDHLEGEAKDEIRYRTRTEREDPERIMSILRELYGCVRSYVSLQECFFSRKQQEGESLHEFSHALCCLMEKVERCAPRKMADSHILLRDQFVEHVLDPNLRRELKRLVREKPECTLLEVRAEAIRWEREGRPDEPRGRSFSVPSFSAVHYSRARPPSLTANSEFTELRQLLEKQQEQLNQLTQGLLALQTAPRPPVRRPNTLLCLRCQKPGHFARECDNERFIPQARPQHVATTSALQEAGNFNPLV